MPVKGLSKAKKRTRTKKFLPRFLARFLTRFLARVLTRVWGRGKTINTVYSTTRPKEKNAQHP